MGTFFWRGGIGRRLHLVYHGCGRTSASAGCGKTRCLLVSSKTAVLRVNFSTV